MQDRDDFTDKLGIESNSEIQQNLFVTEQHARLIVKQNFETTTGKISAYWIFY